jgi:hypothetical protein
MNRVAGTEERDQRRRRPIAAWLLALFPMLVGLGILAPGMVQVMAVEDAGLDERNVRITRRLSRFAHQPLLLPRDFSQGFVPELLDLEHLFNRVEYMADPSARDRLRDTDFPSTYGNVIVIDDVNQRLREIIFSDPVIDSQVVATGWQPPAANLTPLGTSLGSTPGPQYDGYFGPQIDVDEDFIVPEPSTGLMLGLGLLGLAAIRRNPNR